MDWPDLSTTRRVKRVVIAPAALAALLTKTKQVEVTNGIPDTAGVLGGAFDHAANAFVLFVADESFEQVTVGDVPPELPVTLGVVDGTQSSS